MGLTRELKWPRSLRDTTHFGGIQMLLPEWQAKLSLKRKKRTIWRWILSQFNTVHQRRSSLKISFMEETSRDMKFTRQIEIKHLDGDLQLNEQNSTLELVTEAWLASRSIRLLEVTAHLVLEVSILDMRHQSQETLNHMLPLKLKVPPQKLSINITHQTSLLEDMETTNPQNLHMEKPEFKNLSMTVSGLERAKWQVTRDNSMLLKRLIPQSKYTTLLEGNLALRFKRN